MSHRAIRELFRDVTRSLSDKVQFGYGRRSEFNLIKNKRYPYVWLLPLSGGRRFINNNTTKVKTWSVNLVFLDMDKPDANEKESEKILDELDVYVDQWMQRLDDYSLRSDDVIGDLTIGNDNQIPFYKDDSDVTTGWLVTFQLTVSDNFDYCVPDNINLYAGII